MLLTVLVAAAAGCGQVLLSDPPGAPPAEGSGALPNGQPLTRSSHVVYFPVDGTSHHAKQTCGDCHPSPETFKEVTCLSCHAHSPDVAAKRHLHIKAFKYDTERCLSCHPSGGEAPISPEEHSAKYFAIVRGAHGDLSCARCHPDPTTSKVFDCRACHTEARAAAQHLGTSGYVWLDSKCYGCHHPD